MVFVAHPAIKTIEIKNPIIKNSFFKLISKSFNY